MSGRKVIMVGNFPPPMGGAAKNNAILLQSLSNAGMAVVKIDVSAASLSHRRSLRYHWQRVRNNLRAGLMLRRHAAGAIVYMVPNAGAGAWYSLAQVALAQAACDKLVLHHRTLRYMSRWSRPISMLTNLSRDKAVHVFLSPGMAEGFEAQYGRVDHLVASNARFVAEEAAAEAGDRPPGPLALGHLSNLCREKGFFEVADAYQQLRESGRDATLRLAGPVVEPEVQARLDDLAARYGPSVDYRGSVTGAAKRDFYQSLDLFLFPTSFGQEGAPNVVYEALANGVPVLASDRGCIAEMIPPDAGGIWRGDRSFADFVLEYVRDFSLDAEAHRLRAARVKAWIRAEALRSGDQYSALLEVLGVHAGARIEQDF